MEHHDGEKSDAVQDLIRDLETRANRLRWEGYGLLILVALVLMGAAAFSYFAADIAQSDIVANVAPREDKLEWRKQKIQREITSVNNQLLAPVTVLKTSLENLCKAGLALPSTAPKQLISEPETFTAKVIEKISLAEPGERRLHLDDVGLDYITFFGALDTKVCANKLTERKEKIVASIRESLKQIPADLPSKKTELDAELESVRESLFYLAEQRKRQAATDKSIAKADSEIELGAWEGAEWRKLIQTNITRYGSLLVALFLVGFLISQYRYSIRLAAFYDARADVLRIRELAEGAIAFDDLLRLFTPSFEIGKVSTSAIRDLINRKNRKDTQ